MNILGLFKPITTFIFDVDGVLTDGTVLVLDNGLQARKMNIKDGLALQMAIRNGYRVAIISGSNSFQVQQRLEGLGIKEIFMSVPDKKGFIEQYKKDHALRGEQILFMGDDLPDLPAFSSVGLPACPADAVQEIKAAVKYISNFPGGHCCVRDVIEKVLKLNDHWLLQNGIVSK